MVGKIGGRNVYIYGSHAQRTRTSPPYYMSLVQAFWGLSLDVVGTSRRFRGRKFGVWWRGSGVDGFEADFWG